MLRYLNEGTAGRAAAYSVRDPCIILILDAACVVFARFPFDYGFSLGPRFPITSQRYAGL